MAGLFGIGGSGAKTDRKNQLTSWNDLQNLFTFGTNQGKSQTKEGAGNLSFGVDYFKKLASGDRSQMADVLNPQISTITSQAQQKKEQLSTFGNRSGGTNASVQASENEATTAVQNLFEMLGPESAKIVAELGGTQEGLGLGLLDMAGKSASDIGSQSTEARKLDVKTQQEQQAAIIQGLVSLAGMGVNAGTGGAGIGGFGEG